ncbi:MAG: YraN family protein [Alphaproteobacteria bacterium]
MAKAERIEAYKKGARLERLAALYLQIKGYKILKVRYKTPGGEIDIVARRKNTLVFVEVKGRGTMSSALESVTMRNRLRVETAARHFLATHPHFAGLDMRFDAVVFALPFSFRHLDNAWRARS